MGQVLHHVSGPLIPTNPRHMNSDLSAHCASVLVAFVASSNIGCSLIGHSNRNQSGGPLLRRATAAFTKSSAPCAVISLYDKWSGYLNVCLRQQSQWIQKSRNVLMPLRKWKGRPMRQKQFTVLHRFTGRPPKTILHNCRVSRRCKVSSRGSSYTIDYLSQ